MVALQRRVVPTTANPAAWLELGSLAWAHAAAEPVERRPFWATAAICALQKALAEAEGRLHRNHPEAFARPNYADELDRIRAANSAVLDQAAQDAALPDAVRTLVARLAARDAEPASKAGGYAAALQLLAAQSPPPWLGTVGEDGPAAPLRAAAEWFAAFAARMVELRQLDPLALDREEEPLPPGRAATANEKGRDGWEPAGSDEEADGS